MTAEDSALFTSSPTEHFEFGEYRCSLVANFGPVVLHGVAYSTIDSKGRSCSYYSITKNDLLFVSSV